MYNPSLHFHFTGIGGSGMSGIAEVLLSLGFKVSGSDIRQGAVCERLSSLGAQIYTGHDAHHVPAGVSALVYSSAVQPNNPELLEARDRGTPVIPRAEVLAELIRLKYGVAVAGSHGKTTTTSMTAAILETAGLDPTVIIGGQVKGAGSGARLGRGDFLVAESDESDRSFLLLKPTIAVITNIDAEHLSAYSSLADLEDSFEKFARAVPFYGLAILCIDDLPVRRLADRYERRKITYGISPDAYLRATDLTCSAQGTAFRVWYGEKLLGEFEMPMLGAHLAINSLAAIAVGLELSIPVDTIRSALQKFAGVKRRLEVMGNARGVMVINDYGHHPTEVRATLAAVRASFGSSLRKLHVVFQPHRYTRTRDCFVEFLTSFAEADELYVTDIYAASELPIEGVTSQALVEAMNHPGAHYVGEMNNLFPLLSEKVQAGDVVVCLGAGSIGQLPERLLREFAAT